MFLVGSYHVLFLVIMFRRRGLPDATWTKVLEVVHQQGGVNGLRSNLLGNSKLSEGIESTIRECQTKLQLDEQTDLQKRQVWGARWAIPVASEVNGLMKRGTFPAKGAMC